MEFCIEKYSMCIMKSGKRQITEVMELTTQTNQNARIKGNLQILKNIGSGHRKTSKDKIKK